MLTEPKTCQCGQTWRWSTSEPCPITEKGCPTCSIQAREELTERNRVLALEAISALIQGRKD